MRVAMSSTTTRRQRLWSASARRRRVRCRWTSGSHPLRPGRWSSSPCLPNVARRPRRIHLLLSHLHLDHLEGLRFFAPLWDERVTLEIWGPRSPVLSLRDRILRAFSPPLFPLDFRDVPARVVFHTIPKEPWLVEG